MKPLVIVGLATLFSFTVPMLVKSQQQPERGERQQALMVSMQECWSQCRGMMGTEMQKHMGMCSNMMGMQGMGRMMQGEKQP